MDFDAKSSSEENDHHNPTTSTEQVSPRLYECKYCKQGLASAQALGGHMNIHRKDRAQITQAAATVLNQPVGDQYGGSRPISRQVLAQETTPRDYYPPPATSNPVWRPYPSHAADYQSRNPYPYTGLSLRIGQTDDDDEDELDLELRLGHDP